MATRRRLSSVPKTPPKQDIVDYAREVIRAEAEALAQLPARLNGAFARAVEMVLACPGRVVVTGMGKPGFIAQKISATFASTGTPSLYLHPAEALHGDLGRLVPGDLVLALSNSGETDELLRLLPAVRRLGARDVRRTGPRNPTVRSDASLRETAAVMTRTEGRPGAASVVDGQGKLIGIFTDGDLRRLVQSGEVDFTRPVSAVMGKSPRVVGPDDLAIAAAAMLRDIQVDQLPVVDADGRPVGLLDIQDLLAARLLG